MTASIVRETAMRARTCRRRAAVRLGGSTVITRDGTEIYYKDWGEGPVVTFSHGWPLNADAWDGQMLFLAQHGFRVDRARPPRPRPVQPAVERATT